MNTETLTKHNVHKQFSSVIEAWFWALQSKSNENFICTPQTICRMVDQLYRERIISLDHYRVLYFYGMKQKIPNRHDLRQGRAYYLWFEALDKLSAMMVAKDLLVPSSNIIHFDHYRFNLKERCHG